MVVDYASRIAVGGECLHVSVEEEQARDLFLVCGVLLTWLLAPVVLDMQYGGAIYSTDSTLTLTSCTISGTSVNAGHVSLRS